jgi:hypothetical protein
MAVPSICAIEGCDNITVTKGLCDKHYRRTLRPLRTGYEIQCEGCSTSIIKRSDRHRFCEECARARKLAYARAYSVATNPPQSEGRSNPIVVVKFSCLKCGELSEKTGTSQKYCRGCARDRERDQDRERARQIRALRPKKPRRVAVPKPKRERTDGDRAYIRAYEKRRRAIDPGFAVNARMKAMVANVLRGKKNGRSWKELVGYGPADLVSHLERQFLPGMSWDNRTAWDIDHIQPVSSFSFQTAECDEFKACWALSNLRPLWRKKNREKGARRTLLL